MNTLTFNVVSIDWEARAANGDRPLKVNSTIEVQPDKVTGIYQAGGTEHHLGMCMLNYEDEKGDNASHQVEGTLQVIATRIADALQPQLERLQQKGTTA